LWYPRLKALIISGGPAHEYQTTSLKLREILAGAGLESEITEDPGMLASPRMGDFRVVVLNCARWTCDQTPQWRDEWRYLVPQGARDGLVGHLESGGGLLALHAATICFDDWPEFREIIGAWWRWGVSSHSPYGNHLMRVRGGSHPIIQGLQDFTIMDELYTDQQLTGPVKPLVTAEWGGGEHPVLWTGDYRGGRVCYCALGHGVESFENTSFQGLIRRSSIWVADSGDGISEAGE